MRIHTRVRLLLAIPVALCSLLAGGAIRRAQDVCGPFTDVSPAFCPSVLELYYLGITAGTCLSDRARGVEPPFSRETPRPAAPRPSTAAASSCWTAIAPRCGMPGPCR